MRRSSFKKPLVNLEEMDKVTGPDGWKRVAKEVADSSFESSKKDRAKALADFLMKEYSSRILPPEASSYRVTNWVR